MEYIKEYWEWQRNSYVQAKKTKDEYTELFNFNSQNGYAEPDQWVLTTFGKVYIDKIEDNTFYGTDSSGEEVSGKFDDIIRILMKDEVDDTKDPNKKYGKVGESFDVGFEHLVLLYMYWMIFYPVDEEGKNIRLKDLRFEKIPTYIKNLGLRLFKNTKMIKEDFFKFMSKYGFPYMRSNGYFVDEEVLGNNYDRIVSLAKDKFKKLVRI